MFKTTSYELENSIDEQFKFPTIARKVVPLQQSYIAENSHGVSINEFCTSSNETSPLDSDRKPSENLYRYLLLLLDGSYECPTNQFMDATAVYSNRVLFSFRMNRAICADDSLGTAVSKSRHNPVTIPHALIRFEQHFYFMLIRSPRYCISNNNNN